MPDLFVSFSSSGHLLLPVKSQKKIPIKTFLIGMILFNVLTGMVMADEVKINLSKLKSNTTIFLTEGEKLHKVPESGIVKIEPEYLPTLIEINSLRGSKFKTHASIWLTGNALNIKGSIDDGTIRVSPASNGEIMERDLQKEWKRYRKGKDNLSSNWEPLLVYVVNHLQFIKPVDLNKLIEQLPEEGLKFWAGREITEFLHDLDQIGYNASEEQFEHLTALNKDGISERYERPRDRYLLIDFAASWCKPCLDEIDNLAELHRKYSVSLELLSIWNDPDHSTWLNSAKKQKSKITWKSLRDEMGAIFEAFDINTYPTYLLINPEGKVVKRVKGAYLKKIEKYLKRL